MGCGKQKLNQELLMIFYLLLHRQAISRVRGKPLCNEIDNWKSVIQIGRQA